MHFREVVSYNFNISSCDKKYLYPSSLKKHYMVSHKDEYERYLQDKKSKLSQLVTPPLVETCGFHLRDGEDDDDDCSINEDEESRILNQSKDEPIARPQGATFSSLAKSVVGGARGAPEVSTDRHLPCEG
jgi:hypothetical protein